MADFSSWEPMDPAADYRELQRLRAEVANLKFLLGQCLEDNHLRDKAIYDAARAALSEKDAP